VRGPSRTRELRETITRRLDSLADIGTLARLAAT
jgi:hypothetical protein